MDETQILICTAVEMEAKAIARRMEMRHEKDRWRAGSVVLVNVGIAACHIDRTYKPASLLLAAGFGGALDPQLEIGGVVMDDTGTLLTAKSLPQGMVRGRIHTAGGIIETAAEKAALFAQSGALAVDMETEMLRQRARELDVAFVAVRAITDRADETLDPAMARIVDDEGRPKAWAIARELARRPRLAGELGKLGKNAALAADRLAEAVAWIVGQWQGGPSQ